MKLLVTMFTKDEDIIDAETFHQEGCNLIIEEGFTQIYNEIVDASSEYKARINTATIKGTLVGATAVCLIGVGIFGYNKLSNYRKMKKSKKKNEIED